MKSSKSILKRTRVIILAVWLGLCFCVGAAGQQKHAGDPLPVYRDGKWGYSDRSGRMVIEPQFEMAFPFVNGMAEVFRKGHNELLYIDREGKAIAARNFSSNRFSEGTIPIKVGEKYGYADEKGETIIFPRFDGAGDFSEGLAPVQIEGEWGYIDHSGKVIIAPRFDSASSFSEGLAIVGFEKRKALQGNGQERETLTFSERLSNVKYGFINKAGQIVIEPQFDSADDFSDGLAPVRIGSLLALSDVDSKVVKWGYIDKAGRRAIELQFLDARKFSEGLAAVKVGRKWGYIDTTGRVVIPPQFEYALDFTGGLALVASGRTKTDWPYRGLTIMRIKIIGKQGYIDRVGKFVSDKLSWKGK